MSERYYMVRIQYDQLKFAQQGVVAVGWSKMPFVQYVGSDAEAIQAADVERLLDAVCRTYHSEDSSGRPAGKTRGEISRFLGIRRGDRIVVPCTRGFYLAESLGEFLFDGDDLCNRLRVRYRTGADGLPVIYPRKGANLAVTTKLGTRFTVLEYRDAQAQAEIESLFRQEEAVTSADAFRTLEQQRTDELSRQIYTILQDANRLYLNGKGRGFEKLICALLRADGFETKVLSKRTGNGTADADILAVRESGLDDRLQQTLVVQAKHHQGETGMHGLEQLIAYRTQMENTDELSGQTRYILATTAKFTDEVCRAAEGEDILLLDGMELARMIAENLDRLPAETRYSLGLVHRYEHRRLSEMNQEAEK